MNTVGNLKVSISASLCKLLEHSVHGPTISFPPASFLLVGEGKKCVLEGEGSAFSFPQVFHTHKACVLYSGRREEGEEGKGLKMDSFSTVESAAWLTWVLLFTC